MAIQILTEDFINTPWQIADNFVDYYEEGRGPAAQIGGLQGETTFVKELKDFDTGHPVQLQFQARWETDNTGTDTNEPVIYVLSAQLVNTPADPIYLLDQAGDDLYEGYTWQALFTNKLDKQDVVDAALADVDTALLTTSF